MKKNLIWLGVGIVIAAISVALVPILYPWTLLLGAIGGMLIGFNAAELHNNRPQKPKK